MLKLSVEGLQVAAVVDTGSNSTFISRAMLHEIKQHLQASMPQSYMHHVCHFMKPLDTTAQVSS